MIGCYLRVSTSMQADANGTAMQRAEIEKWLDGKGARWFEDAGLSGKSTDRPQWQSLIAAVKAGEVDTVVVYSFTRASRSLSDLSAWVKDMVKRGVRVVSIKEQVDVSTPTGRLMVNLIGCIGEWEREMTADKASDGIRARLSKGEKWGGARRVDRSVNGCAKATPEEWAAALARVERGERVVTVATDLGVSEWAVRKRIGRRVSVPPTIAKTP